MHSDSRYISETARSESVYAEGDIHSQVENVTQATQQTPTLKKKKPHSGSDHWNSKWFNIIFHVIYMVPGTVLKNEKRKSHRKLSGPKHSKKIPHLPDTSARKVALFYR